MIAKGGREWSQYADRLNQYREFLESHGYAHLLKDKARLLYAVTREIAGKKVGIAGFNSAWSCCRNNEKGRLWTGGRWQATTLAGELKDADLKIALVHHPQGWLVEYEANQFWRYGLKKFDVRLHGHEHEQWVDVVNGKATISAGACYDRSDKPNGYNVVRVAFDEAKAQVWLRTYDDRGEGWVADQVSEETDHRGVWVLRGLDWLSPEPPPPGPAQQTPVVPGDATAVPITPDVLKAKASKLGEAVQDILGSELTKITSEAGQSPEVTVAQRVVHTGSITLQQNIIIQVVIPRAAEAPPAPGPAATGSDAIKRKLDDVQELIMEFRLNEADKALDDMLAAPDQLTPRDRFRILIKRGHILHLRQKPAEAASTYRSGATYVEPGDKHAQYFLALAAEIEEKREEAYERILALRQSDREFEAPAVLSLLIRTAPASDSATSLINQMSTEEAASPDVAYTLSHRFRDEGDVETAVSYARIAVQKRPWTDARTSLASLLIEKRFGKIVSVGYSRPPVTDWEDFSEVYELYAVAVAEVERGQAPWHAAMLRMNIAVALAAVGRREDAVSEYEKALKLDPTNPEILFRYAMSLGSLGRTDDAITRVRAWLEKHQAPEITLLLAQLLGSRLTGESRESKDLDEAVALLLAGNDKLPSLDPHMRADWIAVLVQLQIDRGDPAAAQSTLDATPADWLDEPLRLLMKADAEHALGKRTEARATASAAAGLVTDQTHLATTRQLALLLEELEEWRHAASVWGYTAALNAVGTDERHLISCAQRARDYETVIRVCQTLRSRGVISEEVINAEIGGLERVSHERLLVALVEILALPRLSESFKREIRAQRSYIAGFVDRPELVEQDSSTLPRVGDVETANIGRVVVEVLRKGPDPFLAVKYAYELYRRFPEDAHAHLAVMAAAGLPDRDPVSISQPTEVGPGVAVRYRLNDSGEEAWVICEDLASPRPMLNEQPMRAPLVKAMVGERVGDTFKLREGSALEREATVAEIVSKYVYRIRDVIDGFEDRFPEHREVVMKIHAGEDGQQGLDALLRSVDEHAKRVQQLEEIYRNSPVTVHLLANALGRSVFEMVWRIASSPQLELRCVQGTGEDQLAARAAFKDAKALVLDPTALATLNILSASRAISAEGFFAACPLKILVSEHTLADARRTLATISPRGGISVGKEGDQFVKQVITEEDARREHEALRSFLSLVRSKCEVVPAEQPSHDKAASYVQLEDVLGPAGAESVRIAAADAGRVFWTDETFSAQLARGWIGGKRRVWTQSVLDALMRDKKISTNAFEASTTLLFRTGYNFTSLSAQTLLYATAKGGWRASNEPIRSLLTQYASPHTAPLNAARSATVYLAQVWQHRETRSRLKVSRNITVRMLAQIRKHPRGLAMIAYIHEYASRALSDNPQRAKQFRRTVKKFLRAY